MDQSEETLSQLALLAVVSLPACLYLAYARLTRGWLLAYERRWPVPWGAVGAVLAFSLVLLSLFELFLSGDPRIDKVAESSQSFSSNEFVQTSILAFFLNIGFVGLIGYFLATTTGATLRDLGIVFNRRLFLRDVATGLVASLAALFPVYTINALLVFGLGMETEHPTLLRLLTDPNPLVLLAALLTAGIAAPVFEEFVFRLLLQGWLERVEDESLGLVGKLEAGDEEEREEESEEASQSEAAEGALPDPENPYASPMTQALVRMRRRRGEPPAPPEVAFGGLPHGWAPILVSSFLFALVHIGQGAAPVPIFVLALVLGFLYQRTHRLTPSIAAHVTFNVLSLLVTWAYAG